MKDNFDFYGEKLRLARLLNGLTQQELGNQVLVSRQFIHQIEGGIKHPANDVLGAMCEVLQVEEGFFFEPLGNDVKFEQCHFRKRRTTPVGIANRVLAFSTLFEKLILYINEYLELPDNNIPDVCDLLSVDAAPEIYTNEQIERAAELCRKHWGLGVDAPISKMTRVLENAGVVITQYDGVSDKVDALSLNRKHPIIVRNTAKESVCRMRFDLAHECGHFILHDGIETGDKLTESEADKFASAFLFPRSAFVKEFADMKGKRLNWNHIYNLKIRWGMSVRAIFYRAHYLGLITAQQYRGANVRLNKEGQTKVEKHDEKIPAEKPELLENSFEIMSEQLGISFSLISHKLGVLPSMLSEVTGITPPDELHLNNVVPIS